MTWPFGDLQPRAYRTLAIDPPWKFSAGTKGRPQHYPRMTDAEIAALPIADLCHPDGCNIFVWITSSIDGPRFSARAAARRMAEALDVAGAA